MLIFECIVGGQVHRTSVALSKVMVMDGEEGARQAVRLALAHLEYDLVATMRRLRKGVT